MSRVSLHDSRASLQSQQQPFRVPRAASAKSFVSQRPSQRQFQRLESAKLPPTNKRPQVVTIDDLQRMKEQCIVGQGFDIAEEMQRRKEMQAKSQARIKNWPNTIEALRVKRQEEKLKKLEDEEIERRKVDQQEAVLAQEKRQQELNRANKLLHDQQDQVKAFHSKMQLADVLQEREMQVELKKKKGAAERAIDEQWQDLEKQQMEEFDKKTQAKLTQDYRQKMDNAKVIKQQLYDFKVGAIKQLKQQKLEGKLSKKQIEQNYALEQERERARRMKQLEQREVFKKANEDMKAEKEELKRREQEEEKRVQDFAKKKEMMEKLRSDKEKAKFEESLQQRNKLIERQADVLRNMKSREDEILNRQVAEAEEKASRLAEEQERKAREAKEAIEKSRQNQIHKRLNEKERMKQDEKEFAEFWKIRNEELVMQEEQEKEELREREKELKSYINQQREKKKEKVEEEFKKDLEDATKNKALLDHNSKQFYSYAEQCIKEWQAQGKNVKPLIMELKSYNKRII